MNIGIFSSLQTNHPPLQSFFEEKFFLPGEYLRQHPSSCACMWASWDLGCASPAIIACGRCSEIRRWCNERWFYNQPGQTGEWQNERQCNNQLAHWEEVVHQEAVAQQKAMQQPTRANKRQMGGNSATRGDNTLRGWKAAAPQSLGDATCSQGKQDVLAQQHS